MATMPHLLLLAEFLCTSIKPAVTEQSLPENIIDGLVELCPINVCDDKEKTEIDRIYDQYAEKGKLPCCGACSCSDTCREDNDCCFPSSSGESSTKRENQQCMHIHLSVPPTKRTLYRAYYMFHECHPSFKAANVGGTSTEDEEAIWGSLYPMYSPSDGKLYKNISIAKCNYIMNAVPLTPNVRCIEDVLLNVDREVYEYYFTSGTCYVEFTYLGGSPSSLRAEECFDGAVSGCLDETSFSVPASINMTNKEIVDACLSDIYSLYRHQGQETVVFANVFCSICNGKLPSVDICRATFPKNRFHNTFSYFLNFDVIKGQRNDIIKNMACKTQTSNFECRPVYCPSSQLRMPSGHCDFAIDSLHANNIFVKVQLLPKASKDLLTLKHTDVSGDDTLTSISNPWDGWNIILTQCEYDSEHDVCLLSTFVIYLSLAANTTEPSYIFKMVKSNLDIPWIWTVMGQNITFVQSLWSKSLVGGATVSEPLVDSNGNIDFNVYLKRFGPPHPSVHDTQQYFVTKLSFCEQIDLQHEEFELESKYFLLNKLTNKTLYQEEFAKVFGSGDNNASFRICLSDSGLVMYSSCKSQYMIPMMLIIIAFAVGLV